ncbi:helix-turn-helix domain-containing protein, partial [Candidatus Bathyarchaeota archaeon]|nr:helix-turn-helix domain-containing protein [Candidatus Bathyarchaeota archaeon]
TVETKLAEIDPSTSAFKILVYLTFKDQPMKPIEIAKGLGENGSTVRARLAELNKTGLVDNTNEGYVSLLTTYDILMKLYKS